MPSDAEKRAASLAVSRFGADRLRVQSAYQTVAQAQARGEAKDLLDVLVLQKLLTAEQARELRLALDATHIDTNQQPGMWPEAGSGDPRRGQPTRPRVDPPQSPAPRITGLPPDVTGEL